MKKSFRTLGLAFFLAGGFVSAPAFAQPAAPGTDARMQRERAACDGNQQDRAACLREAGAAQQEARRDGLTNPGPSAEDRNALDRCKQQPPSAQAECEARLEREQPSLWPGLRLVTGRRWLRPVKIG